MWTVILFTCSFIFNGCLGFFIIPSDSNNDSNNITVEFDGNKSVVNSTFNNINTTFQDIRIEEGTIPRVFIRFEHVVFTIGIPNQVIICEANTTPVEFRWTFNGQNLSSTTQFIIIQVEKGKSSYLIFPKIKKEHEGNYTCSTRNMLGESKTTLQVSVEDAENDVNPTFNEENENKTTSKNSRAKQFALYPKFWMRYNYDYSNEKIDLEEMLNLIIRRLFLADKVAVSKWDSNSPIEDLPREEIILRNVVQQAEAIGIDSQWATSFFRDQMEANKDIQKGLIDSWRIVGARPDGPPVDLSQEVRPQIDQINQELIAKSKQTERIRKSQRCYSEVEQYTRYIFFVRRIDLLHQKAIQRATLHLCL